MGAAPPPSPHDPPSVELVLRASALGCRPEWLVEVCGLSSAAEASSAASALGAVESAGVFVLDGTEPGSADLHRRLVDAIVLAPVDPELDERHRAWHMFHAGDRDDAIELLRTLADDNTGGGRFEAALADLDVLLSTGAALDGAQHAQLIATSAYAATMADRHDATFRWQVALAEASVAGDDDAQARARYFLHWHGDDSIGEPIDHLRIAAKLAGGGSGWALDCSALLASFEGDLVRTERDAAAALGIARRVGDRRLQLDALNALAYVQSWSGDVERAIVTQQAAARLSDAIHDHRAYGIARMNLALLQFEQLDIDDAIDTVVDGARSLESRGVTAYAALVWSTVGLLKCVAGRPGSAFDLLPPITLLPRDSAAHDGVAPGYRSLLAAYVLTARGEDDELAANMIDDAFASANRFGDDMMIGLATMCRVRRAAYRSQAGEAVELAAAIRNFEPFAILVCAPQLARMGALLGEPRLIEHAVRLVGSVGDRDSRLARLVRDEVAAIADPDAADTRDRATLVRRWLGAGLPVDAAMCEAAGIARVRDASDSTGDKRLLELHHELVRAGAVADAELVVNACSTTVVRADDDDLAGVQAFESLDLPARRSLEGSARERELAKGEVVRRDDEQRDVVSVVRRGSVRLYRLGPDGRQLTIDVVGPGGLVDEDAVLLGSPSSGLWAEAREDTSLWEIPVDVLTRLVAEFPALGMELGAVAARRARHARELAEEIAFWPVERRVIRLLCRLDDQFGRPSLHGGRIISKVFTQEDLAVMVGAGRPSVSLVINELKRDGLLDVRRRLLVLLDREQLEQRHRQCAA